MTPSPTPNRRTIHRSLSTSSPSKSQASQARQRHRPTHSHTLSRTKSEPQTQEQWEAWGDRDDWAEKVGEEDWTGRRMGATKAHLDAWSATGSAKGSAVEVS